MNKVFYDAEDIAADLSIPPGDARKLLKKLAVGIEKRGYPAVKGMIPKAYYEKQKKKGFFLDEPEPQNDRVPLNEKRLLSMGEFCEYAGGIGMCTARKYVRQAGIEVRIGGRCLVDRVKFDRWCDAGHALE